MKGVNAQISVDSSMTEDSGKEPLKPGTLEGFLYNSQGFKILIFPSQISGNFVYQKI
jgi:hypothetical protein